MKVKAIIVGIVFFAFGLLFIVPRGTALVESAYGEMKIVQAEEAAPAPGIIEDEGEEEGEYIAPDEYLDANSEEDSLHEEEENEGDESESGEMKIVQAEEAAPAPGIIGDEAYEYEDVNTGADPLYEEEEGEGEESEYQWPEEEPEGQDNYEYLVPEEGSIPEEDSNR